MDYETVNAVIKVFFAITFFTASTVFMWKDEYDKATYFLLLACVMLKLFN